jgi:hypothetical protein
MDVCAVGNAWSTDFGGGYTEGWVDKALAETIDGDATGMQAYFSRQSAPLKFGGGFFLFGHT